MEIVSFFISSTCLLFDLQESRNFIIHNQRNLNKHLAIPPTHDLVRTIHTHSSSESWFLRKQQDSIYYLRLFLQMPKIHLNQALAEKEFIGF